MKKYLFLFTLVSLFFFFPQASFASVITSETTVTTPYHFSGTGLSVNSFTEFDASFTADDDFEFDCRNNLSGTGIGSVHFYHGTIYLGYIGSQSVSYETTGSHHYTITCNNDNIKLTEDGDTLVDVTNSLFYDGTVEEIAVISPLDNDTISISNFQYCTLDGCSTTSTTIEANPSTGTKTIGSPFTVNVSVNAGEAFNAARATVSVSENLTVNSISNPTSNACNLHYTTTPTTSDPSFAGAIFGDSSENCVVYSMVVTPNAEGTGSITFTNGSVKSYDDNSELLTDTTNASFTLSDGPTPTPTALLEFAVTSPIETYLENFTLTGTKLDTITSIFVNGDDADSTYPTDTTWEVPVTLNLGDNNFTIYGSDGSNQTVTQTITVERHTLGDINGDGEIDLIDASLFAIDWDKTEDLTYILSDMNGDTVVDLTDLSILAKLQ